MGFELMPLYLLQHQSSNHSPRNHSSPHSRSIDVQYSRSIDVQYRADRPLHHNVIMFLLGAVITAVNGALLHRMFTRRHSLKAKRYAFLANLTLCDFLGGLLLIAMSVSNHMGIHESVSSILQGEMCLNLCLTMWSYTVTIGVQFIAVRYPIYYKTTVTRRKINVTLIVCWVAGTFMSGLKVLYVLSIRSRPEIAGIFSAYPYMDQCGKMFYLVGNCACFIYVLNVAVKRRQQHDLSSNSLLVRDTGKAAASRIERTYRSSLEGESNEGDSIKPIINDQQQRATFRRRALDCIQHYDAILTSGIRLLFYIITCTPHVVYSGILLISGDPIRIYLETKELGMWLVFLWFTRALVDPLITLAREKPIAPRRYSTASSTSTTTSTSLTKSSKAAPGQRNQRTASGSITAMVE